MVLDRGAASLVSGMAYLQAVGDCSKLGDVVARSVERSEHTAVVCLFLCHMEGKDNRPVSMWGERCR